MVIDHREYGQIAGDRRMPKARLRVHKDESHELAVVHLLGVREAQVELAHHGLVFGAMDASNGRDGRGHAEALFDQELHAHSGAHGVGVWRSVGQDEHSLAPALGARIVQALAQCSYPLACGELNLAVFVFHSAIG